MRRSSPSIPVLVLAAALVGVVPAMPSGATPASGLSASVSADPVATGLAFPAAFTFFADGRILYGERFTGEIRILDPVTGTDTLFFTVPDLVTAGEQGLLGLALHPSYPAQPYVFAYATRIVDGKSRNQILRITDQGGTGTAMQSIWQVRAATTHDGGVIHFGPDGQLYAVVGDTQQVRKAQRLRSHVGKVLRMTAAGGVPAGNPFNSLVWSYGHRNMFGFDFDPQTGVPWVTENGPACNDEVNRVPAGGNFGWGSNQTCSGTAPQNTNNSGPNPILPLVWYTPTIAPTGGAFCSGCGLGADTEGTFLFGAWNDRKIRRLTLTASRTGVASETVLYTHGSGVLAMETGPDGAVYFSDASSIHRLVP